MRCSEDRAKSIFLDALEIQSDAERAAYVEAQCGNDDELRHEVRALLDHANRLGGFLNSLSEGNLATVGGWAR